MATVNLLLAASLDLEEIASYLLREAGAAVAERFARDFEHILDQLAAFPGSGAPRPRLGRDIRIAIVTPYIFIYRYVMESGQVTVLRVVHGRRKITRRLLK